MTLFPEMKFYNLHTHSLHPQADEISVVDMSGRQMVEWSGFFSLGIHPMLINEVDVSAEIALIEDKCLYDSLLAIGECGLDKRSSVPISEQIFVLELQVALSEKYKKPLIIHCVKAFDELVGLRKRLKPSQKWIIHSFRGNKEQMLQLLSFGFYFSFGSRFNEDALQYIPVDRIFAETDDDESLVIGDVYERLAHVLSISQADLCAIVENNFLKTFNF